MSLHSDGLFIASTAIAIESDCQRIPKSSGIEGGVICTGFIDVEKILRRVQCRHGRKFTSHFFLEKKLPFQVLLIEFETDDDDDFDSSGTSTGSDASSSTKDQSEE